MFAEIDESFNIDPDDIEHRITPQTKVIMAVHLQGNPADMDRILAIARKHRVKVLEDGSQSVGASYKGRPLGSMGDIGIFSLQQSKTITAGEGGAVVTSDAAPVRARVPLSRRRRVRARHPGEARLHARAELPDERIHRRRAAGADSQAGHDHRRGAANAGRVYDGVARSSGRALPPPAGPGGRDRDRASSSVSRAREQRERYAAAMKAENVPVASPGGSVVLPMVPEIEHKVTVTPAWPSFNFRARESRSATGRSVVRGPSISWGALPGVMMGPKYTRARCADAVAAIRKVYPAMV